MSDTVWSIVTLAGLAVWITSTVVFIFTAFPARGVFAARPARMWGAVLIVSYGVWIAGMIHA